MEYQLLTTSGCPWPKATVKPPVWNPGPKIEIPRPENQPVVLTLGSPPEKGGEKKKPPWY